MVEVMEDPSPFLVRDDFRSAFDSFRHEVRRVAATFLLRGFRRREGWNFTAPCLCCGNKGGSETTCSPRVGSIVSERARPSASYFCHSERGCYFFVSSLVIASFFMVSDFFISSFDIDSSFMLSLVIASLDIASLAALTLLMLS